MIPGSSTINFDLITKERIFQSIDSANLQLFADLKKDYFLLKYKLGRIPLMMDFIDHGSRDPYLFVNYSGSYFNFVVKVEKEHNLELSKDQIKLLELFSNEINNAKRIVECLILKSLLEKKSINFEIIRNLISSTYGYTISKETFKSSIDNLNFKFVRKENDVVIVNVDNIELSNSFKKNIDYKTFCQFLNDNIEYSISSYNKIYQKELFQDGFILYQKYSRKDVCRILNWDYNEEATVFGYKLEKNTCPIFVNYHKEENIASSTKFPEKFLNTSQFLWYSKPQRRLTNSTLLEIRNNQQIRLPFFIKKHNGEGTDFYYMGDVKPVDSSFEETTIKNDHNKNVPVVKVILGLKNPVESSIYNYLTYANNNNTSVDSHLDVNVKPEPKIVNLIPLYDFHVAAGSFSEMQSNKDFTLIEAQINNNENNDYFACKIYGESMNRVIPNGSICLFKKYTGGSRNGKIVLVENRDIQDEDFNSAFTIKTYSSEKEAYDENWRHTSIVLRPNSYDDSYKEIIINNENGAQMKVIGEFVKILK
jgi:SOS-response transcriptional repressor LexA